MGWIEDVEVRIMEVTLDMEVMGLNPSVLMVFDLLDVVVRAQDMCAAVYLDLPTLPTLPTHPPIFPSAPRPLYPPPLPLPPLILPRLWISMKSSLPPTFGEPDNSPNSSME